TVQNGATVTYTVTLENSGAAGVCDAANIVIQGFCPDPNGQPTVLKQTFPAIANLPAGSALQTVGTFTCVINLGTGVTTAIARETLSGLLHDNPIADDVLSIQKDVSVLLQVTPPPPVPPPPPVSQIPTMSEWVMIMLGIFLAVVGAFALRKKR